MHALPYSCIFYVITNFRSLKTIVIFMEEPTRMLLHDFFYQRNTNPRTSSTITSQWMLVVQEIERIGGPLSQ